MREDEFKRAIASFSKSSKTLEEIQNAQRHTNDKSGLGFDPNSPSTSKANEEMEPLTNKGKRQIIFVKSCENRQIADPHKLKAGLSYGSRKDKAVIYAGNDIAEHSKVKQRSMRRHTQQSQERAKTKTAKSNQGYHTRNKRKYGEGRLYPTFEDWHCTKPILYKPKPKDS